MPALSSCSSLRRRLGLALVLGLGCWATTVHGLDVIIFKDGFKIEGRKFKEQQVISDAANGVQVTIPAGRGFDIMESGPKWIIYSANTKQVGTELELPGGPGGPPTTREYDRKVPIRSRYPLPGYGEFKAENFDNDWKRTIEVKTSRGNFQKIEQRIALLGPQRVMIPSTTHAWLLMYHPRELGPDVTRALLGAHPDLIEPDGKPDIGKRLDIAVFMRDAGFIDHARLELDNLKQAVPGAWEKSDEDRFQAIRTDLQQLLNRQVLDELDAAMTSGRYTTAKVYLQRFDDQVANADDTKRFVTLKTQLEEIEPRFESSRRLLRDVLDELQGYTMAIPPATISGGWLLGFTQPRPGDATHQTLIEAGFQVWEELHPDTVSRVELFYNLALQGERQRQTGRGTPTKPTELVALAISGWLKGKNGADPNPEAAARLWQARQMLMTYQQEPLLNNRRLLIKQYLDGRQNEPIPFDELAQLISLLPPTIPEDLANPRGKPIESSAMVLPGLLLNNTGPVPEAAEGVDYVLRLPPEYHHGRSYPVLLALAQPGISTEHMVSLLAAEADRNGYIIAAPRWSDSLDRFYDYSGDEHYKVSAVLRDLLRRYRVDNDRVFLFGFGDGANFALDVGASHPDQYAGVVAMGPNPRYIGMFMHYWRNLQKLPVFIVNGNLNGNSFENQRKLFEHWMPKGFPAMMTIYRGRGMEWFADELPTVFRWMCPNPYEPDRPKRRVTGTASLRLGQFGVEPWYTMRRGDNRFYWVGTDDIADRCLLENNKNKSFIPAEIYADIRQGNLIDLRTRGVKHIAIWLERDMIDWTKPVFIRQNGSPLRGYKAKVMEPDLYVMLENFYQHGDRKLLFLNKIDLEVLP